MSCSLKYGPDISLVIGVSNYQFYLSSVDTLLKISFWIKGNFLAAAINDDIKTTVDYDGLCQAIRMNHVEFKGKKITVLAHEIKKTILDYSPLIKGGLLNIDLVYKHTVIERGCDF